MLGYVDNNFRAIVKPKQVLEYTTGFLIPEFEYTITKQQYPEGNPEGLKRSFIQGNGIAMWIGVPLEDDFEIIEVLSQ
jgi:hypothetical protein